MIFRFLMLAIASCVAASIILHPPIAHAQSDIDAAQVELREAFAAYNAKDYEAFVISVKKALALNQHSIATRYYLARGYALTGQIDQALEVLGYLVSRNIDYGYAEHRDFESLRGDPRFARLITELAERTSPVINGLHRYTIDQLGIIPEGIAHDAATNRLFLSSMRTGDIYVLDADNSLSLFATVKDAQPMAAIGLFADSERHLLWAVGATFEMTRGFDPDAETQTGVFGFDLTDGTLQKKILAGDVATFFNDLTVAADGRIYLSGSDLCVIEPHSDTIERLPVEPHITGSNGVTATPDGKFLFVSSYPVGVYAIELETGQARLLELPANASLYGIDGMYVRGGSLVAVQNGIEPWRLVHIELDENFGAVTGIQVLEFGNPDIGPTTGALDGDVIHLVGQGPAPESAPGHFPGNLREFLGKTVIYSVPVD
ncbi:MAG: hypothetical protein KJO31_12305 [Gammaproteobacteria bacterium]|nr:hypothetical protein [Gammaproteobacteria bacterium]